MTASLTTLPAGTVVAVSRGLYRHVGLLAEATENQERNVISLNPGSPCRQLIEEPISMFARGKSVQVVPIAPALPSWSILARARSGKHPQYSWAAFNCEHFVRFALGHKLESPQLAMWAIIGLVVGFSSLS